jgi:hypothetical protein
MAVVVASSVNAIMVEKRIMMSILFQCEVNAARAVHAGGRIHQHFLLRPERRNTRRSAVSDTWPEMVMYSDSYNCRIAEKSHAAERSIIQPGFSFNFSVSSFVHKDTSG